MKNFAKFLGIIVMVAIIGFSFAACDDGNGGDNNNGGGGFVAVTNITGVSTAATVGTPLTLTGTVEPSTATNKTIAWSVVSGTATISGSTLNATAAGSVTVKATIANGTAQGTNYTKDFNITVSGTGGAGNGTFTLTGIPAEHNGKYAFLSTDNEDVLGYQSLNSTTGEYTLVSISGGSVTIPLWNSTGGRYSGNDTFSVYVDILGVQTATSVDDVYDSSIGYLQFEITFSNGSAAKAWSAEEYTAN